MIITRISGGLGNQMFQYAIAKAIAKRNDDSFKLDISFYPKQTLRKYELSFFKIEENIATEKECIKLRNKEGFIYKIRKKFGFKIKRPDSYTFEENITTFDKKIWNKKGDIYLDGFWQNEEYFKDIRDEILQDFTLKNDISNEAKKYLEDIKNSQSVSIHIRRGDYVQNTHTNSVHGTCDLEYYKKAINYIEQNVEKPNFYIFSDDIAWCKENFDFLENKAFVDDTKSAFDDLELMKNCKHNIIANSTFSWWGAWLNTNDKKIVVAPSVWFITNSKLTLSLKNWIKI